jgi:AcrR family transcriptional regulator
MRDKSRTKGRIEQTALRLFVEKGFTETTIRDIAMAAKLSEGALYRHYGSKEELGWALFSRGFTEFAQELDRVQRQHRTLKAKLGAMIRHFCTFFDRDSILFSYLLLTRHALLRKVTQDMPHPMLVLRAAVIGGMARREIPKGDPDVATSMVMGMVLQVALNKIYGRVKANLSDLADQLVRASWRVLRG